MRRSLSAVFLGLALSFGSAERLLADVLIPEMNQSIVLLTSTKSNYVDGRLIADTINELRAKSATFDEMVRLLGSSRLLTMIKPKADLRAATGLIGRTRFSVGSKRTVAFVELLPLRDDIRTRREAVAHELAHVVEVACLGPVTDQDDLHQRMRLQLTRFSERSRSSVLETRFASTVAKAVVRETLKRRTVQGQLTHLLGRDGLTSCPTPLLGREVTIAQLEEPETRRNLELDVDVRAGGYG